MKLFRGHRPEPGLISVPPVREGFQLTEEVSGWWLALLAVLGGGLIVLSVLLNLYWEVQNILPSLLLELGAGAILFSLLFLLERRIVRRTSLMWVSALEQIAVQTGQDEEELAAHLGGPVATVHAFVDAVRNGDYRQAWTLADPNWRLCRAQNWLWVNSAHPSIQRFDRDKAAKDLAEADPTHELWEHFAQTELEEFSDAWSAHDLSKYGAASRPRKLEDGEVVLLIDLSEHPTGAMVEAPTLVGTIPFLVRQVEGEWRIANLLGDRLPRPGWPSDWNEGWTYMQRFRDPT